MLYNPEDFGSFAPIRMAYTPSKPTTVSLIFTRPDDNVDSIKVLFGFEIYPHKYFDNSPTLEKS